MYYIYTQITMYISENRFTYTSTLNRKKNECMYKPNLCFILLDPNGLLTPAKDSSEQKRFYVLHFSSITKPLQKDLYI